jgi:hypothetical protein
MAASMNQQMIDILAPGLNLTTHRAPGASVWNRPGWDGSAEPALARWLVAAGGGALAMEGLRRRGLRGSLFAGVGGALLWWAATGDLTRTRLWLADLVERRVRSTDPVHAASDESFPASDPTAFTPTVGTALRAGRDTIDD